MGDSGESPARHRPERIEGPVDNPPEGEGQPKSEWTLTTVAAAVASGLGVLGFATLAGGVVLWSRYNGMGIPADHALGLVPKPELVATGAEFLVPSLLLSALLVAIVMPIGWAIDDVELFKRIQQHELDKHKLLRRCKPIVWLHARLDPGKLPPSRWLVAPVLLGLAELGFAIAALTGTIPTGPFIVLVLVAGLGAFVVSLCAQFGTAIFYLVAFLAVGSFAVARVYELTSHDLKVLPMAYVRAQPGDAARVETGYFVAETSDRIIFASTPHDEQNELREFPRNETDDLEVGSLARPEEAEQNAAHFAYNLCLRLLALKPVKKSPYKGPVCSQEYRDELREEAKLPNIAARH